MEGVIFKNTYHEEVYQFHPSTAVIISTPWSDLKKAETDLLEKILGAVGLSTAAVSVVHQAIPHLDEVPPPATKVIVFAGATRGIALHEMIETPLLKAVFTRSLNELIDDDESKRKLWLVIKPLFGR